MAQLGKLTRSGHLHPQTDLGKGFEPVSLRFGFSRVLKTVCSLRLERVLVSPVGRVIFEVLLKNKFVFCGSLQSIVLVTRKTVLLVAASNYRSSTGHEIELKASGGASGCRNTVRTWSRTTAPKTVISTLPLLRSAWVLSLLDIISID